MSESTLLNILSLGEKPVRWNAVPASKNGQALPEQRSILQKDPVVWSESLVSVITVNYNEAEVTCALLDSIRRQPYRPVEVIVVDNASRENPETLFRSRYPEVTFLRSEQNLGFAGGNNLALKHATGAYLFFVNNDAELTDHTIGNLLQLFENQPQAGIVSPLICYAPEAGAGAGPDLIQYAGMTPIHPLTGRNRTIGNREPDSGQYSEPKQTAYAHGAAMMVPRRVLDLAGPMQEDFFLYYEELDWSERIRKAGWQVWVQPLAKVYHKESLTVKKLGALKTYFLNRNRVWFMRRHFGRLQRIGFYIYLGLVLAPKNIIVYTLHGEWANLRAFLRGVWWNVDEG